MLSTQALGERDPASGGHEPDDAPLFHRRTRMYHPWPRPGGVAQGLGLCPHERVRTRGTCPRAVTGPSSVPGTADRKRPLARRSRPVCLAYYVPLSTGSWTRLAMAGGTLARGCDGRTRPVTSDAICPSSLSFLSWLERAGVFRRARA